MNTYTIHVNTDAYSMPLYECDGMTEEEVRSWLLEKNCLEPVEYELMVESTENDDGFYSYDDYPMSCIENC